MTQPDVYIADRKLLVLMIHTRVGGIVAASGSTAAMVLLYILDPGPYAAPENCVLARIVTST